MPWLNKSFSFVILIGEAVGTQRSFSSICQFWWHKWKKKWKKKRKKKTCFYFMSVFYYMYICMTCAYKCLGGIPLQPEWQVVSCKALLGCWEQNVGPLQKQQVILTTEPSIQPKFLNDVVQSFLSQQKKKKKHRGQVWPTYTPLIPALGTQRWVGRAVISKPALLLKKLERWLIS